MNSFPKYHVLNHSVLMLVQKTYLPLSERFASEESCLSDSTSTLTVELLTSDFKRRVSIEEKVNGAELARQKAVSSRRLLQERVSEELKKRSAVDPRPAPSQAGTDAKKELLDLPLPRFWTAKSCKTSRDMQTQRSIDVVIGVGREAEVADDASDQNPSSRSSMMKSLLGSIPLLDELTDNEFDNFCHKIGKFQRDIDAAISKHHIAHSDS